jgi:hypothetical protein
VLPGNITEPAAGVEPATSRLQGACSTAELCGRTRTNAGPAFRDLSGSVIGRFASIRFGPVVEKSNPTRSLSSPRRELNSNLRFTKPMHDLRATRAGAGAQEIDGAPSLIACHQRRADDGDRTRLNQLGKLTPHQAASSAEDSESRFKHRAGDQPASHRCKQRSRDRLAGFSVPVHIVEVRGIEPPVPASQTPCSTVEPHLEIELVPPVGLEPTRVRVRTGCSALELRRQKWGRRRESNPLACGHAADATRARRVLCVGCLLDP